MGHGTTYVPSDANRPGWSHPRPGYSPLMDVLTLRLVLWLGRPGLRAVLGETDAARVVREAPAHLRELLPRIPDLGRPAARFFLVATAGLVAVRRAIPERPPADATAALGGALRSTARVLPRPVRRLYRAMFFAPWYHRRLVDGLVSDHPQGFQGRLLSHPDGFGVEYTGCALQAFLRSSGHPELGPEICGLDEVESDIFELGLRRTGTIGRGAPRCDFRWTRT